MRFIEDIKCYGFFSALRFAWQRVVRGYDTPVTWSFDTYFHTILPALKAFCEKELEESPYAENTKRIEIYKRTLELIVAYENMSIEDEYNFPNQESELWKFVGEHIAWYWD